MWYSIRISILCGLVASATAEELTLEEALHLAEQQATELRTLEAEVALATATHKRTAQAFLPKVSTDAAWLRADGSLFDDVPAPALRMPLPITYHDLGPVDTMVSGIQVVQPLFHADAWKQRKKAAHSVEAQRLSYDWGRRIMRVRVTSQYYAVAVRQTQETAARKALKAARQAWQMADAAYAEGLVARLDVARADAEVKGRQAMLAMAEAEVQREHVALQTLLGLPLEESVTLVSKLPGSVPPPRAPVPAAERSDHLAWEARNAAAQAGVEKAKAGWLPRANLLARQQWVDIDEPIDRHVDGWLVALQLQWTLFDGLGREGAIAEARARRERSRIQVEQSRREIAEQQQVAIDDWQSAWSAWRASKRAMEAADEATTLAQRQYEEGVGNMTDLLAAQAALYQHRLENSRYQYQVLTASMHYYLRHGLDPLTPLLERDPQR